MERIILFVTTCLLAYAPATAVQPSVTLPDTSTVISGEQKTVSGKSLDIYLSIPYAQPPTGERRFKDPEPITNLPSQINATQFPLSCYQKNFSPKDHVNSNMSEDCLYLNIWAPSKASKRDVVIFIYGGGFEFGSTDQRFNNPQYLAARTGMVIVTINYRVGSFGFLDLNKKGADGNLGLKDQILAFKWVKKNIKVFGGSPVSVTLYGLSAGSMSIAFHLSIKENQDLFKRAFLQSGTSNSGFFNSKTNKQKSLNRFYEVLNCNPNSSDILQCLQSKSSEEILNAENQAYRLNYLGTFLPNFNGKLFPYTSIIDFNKKDVLLNKDIIIGTTKDEASSILLTRYLFALANATKQQAIAYIQDFMGQSDSAEFTKIANSYMKDVPEHDYVKYSIALEQLLQDYVFRCPIFYFSNIMASKNNRVFFYYYTYTTEYRAKNASTQFVGAAHGEDQPYVMGLPQRDSLPYTQNEIEFSNRMMDYLGNFAKFGFPGFLWRWYSHGPTTPPYTTDSRPHRLADLNADYHLRMIDLPHQHRCTEDWRPFFYPNSV